MNSRSTLRPRSSNWGKVGGPILTWVRLAVRTSQRFMVRRNKFQTFWRFRQIPEERPALLFIRHKSVLDGILDQGRDALELELCHHAVLVKFYRPGGNVQEVGNFFGRVALNQ
jgi:hypothetical protein